MSNDNKQLDYTNLMFSGNKVEAIVVTTLASLTIIGGVILLLQYVSRLKHEFRKTGEMPALSVESTPNPVNTNRLTGSFDIMLMVSSIESIVDCDPTGKDFGRRDS